MWDPPLDLVGRTSISILSYYIFITNWIYLRPFFTQNFEALVWASWLFGRPCEIFHVLVSYPMLQLSRVFYLLHVSDSVVLVSDHVIVRVGFIRRWNTFELFPYLLMHYWPSWLKMTCSILWVTCFLIIEQSY